MVSCCQTVCSSKTHFLSSPTGHHSSPAIFYSSLAMRRETVMHVYLIGLYRVQRSNYLTYSNFVLVHKEVNNSTTQMLSSAMSAFSPTGEETLHWFQLPTGWTGGQRHSTHKCGSNPHGLPPRDPVQWAQFSCRCSEGRCWQLPNLMTDHGSTNVSQGIKRHRLDGTCIFF